MYSVYTVTGVEKNLFWTVSVTFNPHFTSSINQMLSFSNKKRQCEYKVTMRRIRETIVATEKQRALRIVIVYVCVALVIQNAKRMRPIIFLFMSCLAVLYFSTCLLNGTIL
jgi:hypothetical protein